MHGNYHSGKSMKNVNFAFAGHYLRIPSSRLAAGDKAVTILKDFSHSSETGLMLSLKMYYHTSSIVGGFTISVTRMRRAPIEVFTIDTETQHMDWKEINICMPPGKVSLLLTATQGDRDTSDIALDDVQFTGAPCHDYIKFSGEVLFLKD